MRKIVCVFIFVITMVALQIGQVNDVFAGKEWNESRGKAFKCSIAGVWESPVGGLATIVPLDPTGKRYSIIFDAPPPEIGDPSINWSLLHGIVDKSEPNLYGFTLYRYGVLGGIIQFKIVVSGLTKFTDCDTRAVTYTFQVYDGDGNELGPCQLPPLGYVYRIQSEQPCDDLQPFPEE